MQPQSPYTFKDTPEGNVEVFQGGNRISTGTRDAMMKQYGNTTTPDAPVDPSLVNKNADYFNKSQTTTPTQSPTDTPSPVGTPTPYYPRVGSEPTPYTAETEQQVVDRKMKNAQAIIDSINKVYDQSYAEQQKINEGRSRATNAISVMSGLSGGTEAYNAEDKTNVANKKELDSINAQRQLAIQGVLTKIQDSAYEEARQQREEARKSAEDIANYRAKAQTDAVNHLALLSKANSGATLEGLKATLSPQEYDYLVRNAGGEQYARAVLFENRPKSTVLGTPQVMGDKMVQAYTQPDGSVKYESVPLPAGVKANNIKSVEKTDNGIFIINNDGTWSKITGSEAVKKPTISDTKSGYIDQYTSAFTPGVRMKDGTPTIDKNGFITPVAWKEAIKEAPTKGISRADFIKTFGYLLYSENGKLDPSYGLTPAEKRLIETASGQSSSSTSSRPR